MREKKLIILVFESKTTGLRLQNSLEKENYSAIICNSANKAENSIKELFPDFIISDCYLSERDGFDLCQSLKRNINYSDIPFVFFSQLESPEDQVKADFANADAFIGQSEGVDYLIVQLKKLEKNHNETILLIEDSPTQGAELKYLLEKNGFSSRLVLNGKIALRLLEVFRPRIILSDIRMPEMNGIELCKAIKENPELCSIPVILLTSLASPLDVIEAISAGADYYFPKSYSEKYMIEKISQTLCENEKAPIKAKGDPIEIAFSGNSYKIDVGREKLLKLLFSTYEIATIQNSELMKTQLELKRLNENLEETVKERTLQLLTEANEKEKIEKQLIQAQKMEAVGQLTSGIAHDFNNILQVILGYGEILAEVFEENDPKKESLSNILHAGEQAMGLVRQLLTFSKKTEANRVEMNIETWLDQIVKMSKRIIGSHITFSTSVEKNLPCLVADPTMMEQSILNLFINARDAMPEGGKICVRIFHLENKCKDWPELFADKTDYIAIEIADTGKGISPENLSKIFDPFFTTKAPGKGTGLGLASVYACINKHKGHIKAKSTLGIGTAFTIILPILSSKEIDQLQQKSAIDQNDLSGNEKLFLAEDDPLIRSFISKLLIKHGYQVDSENDGVKAIECLEQKLDKYSLIILDAIMPGKTGMEVATFIRSKNSSIPILFSTGNVDNLSNEESLKKIHAELIQKPFSPNELLAKVKEILLKTRSI